jgi:hypothetical protein
MPITKGGPPGGGAKVRLRGLGDIVQRLRTTEDGQSRSVEEISALLKAEGYDIGVVAVRSYLEKLDAQAKPVVDQALKEAVTPQAVSSMEILAELEQQLFQKVQSTGNGADKLGGAANATRALLEVIKTKFGLVGIKLADSDRTEQDLRAELDAYRQRVGGTGATPRNGSAGTPDTPRLPN